MRTFLVPNCTTELWKTKWGTGGSQKTERVEMLYLLLILFLEHSKVSCEPTLCLFFSNGREVQHNASSAHSAQLFKYML